MTIKNFVLMAAAIILGSNVYATSLTDNSSDNTPINNMEPRRYSDANIHGHIIDAKSNEHIPFVTISVKDTTIGTVADASGHFFLKNLPIGKHTIIAEVIGYESAEMEVARVSTGSTALPSTERFLATS